jgi:hypothetical protein
MNRYHVTVTLPGKPVVSMGMQSQADMSDGGNPWGTTIGAILQSGGRVQVTKSDGTIVVYGADVDD